MFYAFSQEMAMLDKLNGSGTYNQLRERKTHLYSVAILDNRALGLFFFRRAKKEEL